MAKRLTMEEKYKNKMLKQQKILEEFAALEIEWADNLLMWYRLRNQEIPDDQYRAVAFFKNNEYLRKPGSLTLLYQTYMRCINELPNCTKEIAFDLLAYRYKMYAAVLKKGGYGG